MSERPEVQIVDGELQCPVCKDGDSLNFNCDVVEVRGVELHTVGDKQVLGVYYGSGHEGEGDDDRLFCGHCCSDLAIPEKLEILWDPTPEELDPTKGARNLPTS